MKILGIPRKPYTQEKKNATLDLFEKNFLLQIVITSLFLQVHVKFFFTRKLEAPALKYSS